MQEPGIAVLDFGSQYTQTIARRFRQDPLNTYSEIFDPDVELAELDGAVGIIGSGGPDSAYKANSPRWKPEMYDLPVPKLLICYAFQAYAHDFGGETVPASGAGEYGKTEIVVDGNDPLFASLPQLQTVWMSHGDKVAKLPSGMRKLASSKNCEYAAAWNPKQKTFGVQFHPEVDNTQYGKQILNNFLALCERPSNPWTYERFIAEAPKIIREKAHGRKVAHLASGGKDSSVSAILLKTALGNDVSFLHINCGIERKGEVEENAANLRSIGAEPVVLDTSEELERELAGVTDAEAKRHIIGRHYIRHAERWAHETYGEDWMIGQGTIYPDHIESKGTKHSAKIKTHHNRVAEVLELIKKDRIIEPNLYLFKDDIEALAKIMGKEPEHAGMASIFAPRHPFPGPGLAIRMLCSDGKEPEGLNDLSLEANKITSDYNMSALVLPVRSVGVQGDERTYAPPVAVWGELNVGAWDELEKLSTELTNKMRGKINRVVCSVLPEEIGTAELREAYVTKARLDKLREADAIVMNGLEKSGEMKSIQQCPTISLPLEINGRNDECIVVRPFKTKDFMTGSFGRLSEDFIDKTASAILRLGYGGLFYDITNKPPGTTEWE